ncbi:hypothetical protein AURDEDRAFT_140403 [Auricularia subglabra TFB-10046 SS5]|uniref:Tyr recombinase domain-containing protein n=1 Tax=Auricularia subglabra (strain TFB-10046 / SS5) TaxID=717982 RepID=J0WSV6_AURST|nr:hypothetical protein AURDEDRAFT_140403 [Auricularia subglabra TFB-10046 SS5]
MQPESIAGVLEHITDPDINEEDNEYNHVDNFKSIIAEASKGVSAGTHREYTACDDKDHTGRTKPSSEEHSGYTYAQKMRASMTYFFGKEPTIGLAHWHLTTAGVGVGNPSVSHEVLSYMTSLRRRKVLGGEVPTSARAITPDVLRRLWEFNHRPENWDTTKDPNACKDGSPGSRRLLHAAYTLAFVCLLRFDEVMKIQSKHIAVETLGNKSCIKLMLSYWKTNQYGGVKPFYLHRLHESEKHLCPVRALSEWLNFYNPNLHNRDGYIFPSLAKTGTPIHNTQMTSEAFLELFRNNLSDIQVDNATYRTHSFRRGGCQWLSCDKRWSTEFQSLTIVKYLLSWNDDPQEKREDLLDPDRPLTVRCPLCGRNCACS